MCQALFQEVDMHAVVKLYKAMLVRKETKICQIYKQDTLDYAHSEALTAGCSVEK